LRLFISGFVVFGVLFSPRALPQSPGYDPSLSLDLTKSPFSRYGSYLALSHLPGGSAGDGLYLRSLHGRVAPEIFRVQLFRGDQPVSFTEAVTPTLLRLVSSDGFAEICFSDPATLRIRGRGLTVRLTRIPGGVGFVLKRAADRWEYDAVSEGIRLTLYAIRGELREQSTWEQTVAKDLALELGAKNGDGEWDFAIHESAESVPPLQSFEPFETAAGKADSEYRRWLLTMPTVDAQWQPGANLAAYILWSAVVDSSGEITRPTIYMSKGKMDAVWSWDHCFNAMALAQANPKLSWDQMMVMFDRQSPEGALPDKITDRGATWAYSKPPIHGWALSWMLAHDSKTDPAITNAMLAEIYPKLRRWTDWYFRLRSDSGIPQYDHGNDSGWDNSTVFAKGPHVETPDLLAYLSLQLQAQATIADRLGHREEANTDRARALELTQEMLAKFWRKDHFVAIQADTQTTIESDSLLLYMPLVLGRQLPENVRASMIAALKQSGGFLTDNGLASERVTSKRYESDGYWRGPIWAPAMMILATGLEDSGQTEFARELKLRFCRMVLKSGTSENYDAVTGQPLRDSGYSWSASVYLIFAHEVSAAKN
jgi:glycogen debranching enzyme